MEAYIKNLFSEVRDVIDTLPLDEIAKAIHYIQATYENDGRIYIFGNGGSLALATHWVSDFNKTVFSHNLKSHPRRFQAIRVPTTEEEMSAWANDEVYEMVFLGPLQNYLRESDCIIAISSSGNSQNIIKAVEFACKNHVPVIGLSGFDGGKLNQLADAKVFVRTDAGRYDIVEGIHGVILHMIIKYFQDYFDHVGGKEAS